MNPTDHLAQLYQMFFHERAYNEYIKNPKRPLFIRDIKEECQKVFVEIITQHNSRVAFDEVRQQVLETEKKNSTQQEQDDFYKKNTRFFEDLKNQSDNIIKESIENFLQGQALLFNRPNIFPRYSLLEKKKEIKPKDKDTAHFPIEMLKNQSSLLSINTLTINDIKEKSRKEFLKYLIDSKSQAIIDAQQKIALTLYLKDPSPKEEEDFIEKNNVFFEDVRIKAKLFVKNAVDQFEKGGTLNVVTEINLNNLKVDQTLIVGFQEEKQLPGATQLKLRGKLFLARDSKKREASKQDFIKEYKEYKDFRDYVFFLSARLKKGLDEPFSMDDFENPENKRAFNDFLESKRIRNEKALERMLESSSISEPPKVKPKAKGKKKKQDSVVKKETVEKRVNTENQQQGSIIAPSIFPQNSVFVLDKRITRWFQATPKKVKQFTDKVSSATVHQYANLSPEMLEEQILYHKLPGIELLMSLSPTDLPKYSSTYEFMHHGSLKKGRCFQARLKQAQVDVEGVIYVGAERNRIYHAKFVPLKTIFSENLSSKSFCLPLEGDELEEEQEPMQLPCGYHFDVIDDLIVWNIKTDKGLVEFEIAPIS